MATVSHAINGTRKVAPDTVERIRKARTELDYHPNSVARSLRTRRTNVIGVIVSDITNPFFANLVRGAEDAAIEAGYSLIVCNSDESSAREDRYIRLLRGRRIDGLLVSPVGDGSSNCIRKLGNSNLPFVFVDRTAAAAEGDAVLSANVDGARKATSHLVERGHSRIGIVLGIPGATTTEERLEGYCQALEKGSIPFDADLVQYGGYRVEGGRTALRQLLALAVPPTAVFSTNNLMTVGVLREVERRELRVPADLAIVAFDDLPVAMVAPRLTAVCQKPTEIGAEAVRLLLERLHGRGGRRNREIRIPVELVVRESA